MRDADVSITVSLVLTHLSSGHSFDLLLVVMQLCIVVADGVVVQHRDWSDPMPGFVG